MMTYFELFGFGFACATAGYLSNALVQRHGSRLKRGSILVVVNMAYVAVMTFILRHRLGL